MMMSINYIFVSTLHAACIMRINNVLAAMPKEFSESGLALDNVESLLETAREEIKKLFEKEAELDEKLK